MADEEEIDVEKLDEESKAAIAQLDGLQRDVREMSDACQTMQKDMKESEVQLKKHHALIKDLD